MVPIFIIKNENSQSKFEDKDSFINYVRSLGNGIIEVVAKKKRRARTTGKDDELGNQNGWYHACILPLSMEKTGYSNKEMHELFIEQFAPYTIKMFMGKPVKVKIRTSEMDTVQFQKFTDDIRNEMATMGVIIPDPIKIR